MYFKQVDLERPLIKLGLNSCLRKTNKCLGEELSRQRQEKAKALRPKSEEFELVESREANADAVQCTGSTVGDGPIHPMPYRPWYVWA